MTCYKLTKSYKVSRRDMTCYKLTKSYKVSRRDVTCYKLTKSYKVHDEMWHVANLQKKVTKSSQELFLALPSYPKKYDYNGHL